MEKIFTSRASFMRNKFITFGLCLLIGLFIFSIAVSNSSVSEKALIVLVTVVFVGLAVNEAYTRVIVSDTSLTFAPLIGPRTTIPRADIVRVSVERLYPWYLFFSRGGNTLCIKIFDAYANEQTYPLYWRREDIEKVIDYLQHP